MWGYCRGGSRRKLVRLSVYLPSSPSVILVAYVPLSFFCLSDCLYVCLSVSLSLCLSVSLSICPSVCLSACLSICPSVYLSVCLPGCMSVCLTQCVYLPSSPSVIIVAYVPLSLFWLSVCLSVCISLSLFLPFCLSVRVGLSIHPFIRLPACLTIFLCLFSCLFISALCSPVVCFHLLLPIKTRLSYFSEVTFLALVLF